LFAPAHSSNKRWCIFNAATLAGIVRKCSCRNACKHIELLIRHSLQGVSRFRISSLHPMSESPKFIFIRVAETLQFQHCWQIQALLSSVLKKFEAKWTQSFFCQKQTKIIFFVRFFSRYIKNNLSVTIFGYNKRVFLTFVYP
jgi:hypothetical protein